MQTMIIIIAILKAKTGKEAELKEEKLKVVESSRNESG
jgi:quinol monooxygenase YgiN